MDHDRISRAWLDLKFGPRRSDGGYKLGLTRFNDPVLAFYGGTGEACIWVDEIPIVNVKFKAEILETVGKLTGHSRKLEPALV